ncbi:hypothetical protein, partial [Polymorphobacter multimanifer]|uniref:hypothetical protein n=1 Tax=Polymorphobacter multimanifer TaxID=1070431 RepID=UPI001FB112ED
MCAADVAEFQALEGTTLRGLLAAGVALMGSGMSVAATAQTYPVTATGPVAETLHGERIADPYRWLEDDVRTSPAVAEWVAA